MRVNLLRMLGTINWERKTSLLVTYLVPVAFLHPLSVLDICFCFA